MSDFGATVNIIPATFIKDNKKELLQKKEKKCSRKNFVILFGTIINLTVKVDAYFPPIRMTYPIQPGSSFRAAQIGESRQTLSLFFRTSSFRTDVITACSLQ